MRDMKKFMVRIVEDSHLVNQGKDAFLFPTSEDEDEFYKEIGDPNQFMTTNSKGRVWKEFYKAWQVLGSMGWVNDEMVDGFLVWVMPETPIEKLELKLKNHDWWYMMSDDHRVYTSGQYAMDQINRLMKEVGEPVATELFNRYAPK